MAIKWIRTAHTGLRYYESLNHKHGKQRDRYYSIRFRVDKKLYSYGVGWMSDGIPEAILKEEPELGFQDYCLKLLRQFKGNVKTGEGPKSPKEKRSIEAAKKAAEKAEMEREDKESITVAAYCKETYFPWAKQNKAANTYRVENLLFTNWIKPVIGSISLVDVVQIDIERIKHTMFAANKAPKTVHHTLGLIRQIYNHAKRPDIYLRAKVKMPKVDNAKLRYLTPAEINRLLIALKEKSVIVHDQALIAVNCGLRFSEVAGLRREDVNYDTGTIAIRDAKTGSRTVFLNEDVTAILKARQDEKETGLVFPDNEGNRQARCSKTFQRVADELFNKDIKDRRLRISFHSLRHTFGTHVYENSGDLYLTQKALGHRTMVMASRYAKMSEKRLREAFTKMSEVMKKGRETHPQKADQNQTEQLAELAI